MQEDAVQFEVAEFSAAIRLAKQLSRNWAVLLDEHDDVAVVTPYLRSRQADLALLLREVEAWIEQESLFAISFEVDGRKYVLQAGEVDWEKAPGFAT